MKSNLITMALLLILSLIQSTTTAATKVSLEPENRDLQAWLMVSSGSDANRLASSTNNTLHPVARFYQMVGFRPVWSNPYGLLPQGELLLHELANASDAGLVASDYDLAGLNFMCGKDGRHANTMLAPYLQFDVMLTDGLLRYAEDLSQGRVRPETLYKKWLARRRRPTRDIPTELAQAVTDENRLRAFIDSLHPDVQAYRGLKNVLHRYDQIRRSGGWPTIASGPTLKKGDLDPRIPALIRRLQMTDDLLDDQPLGPGLYDECVTAAVKRFQRRHGLAADGLVGKHTRAELNIPVEERIARLKLNMERWRWFPDNLGERYLLVNIPAYALSVVEAHTPINSVRAIVGKQRRQTPIMSGRMTYIELNPYWNIPQNIARKDILPKVLDDPTYLARQGIRVFDSWDSKARELDPTSIAWEQLSVQYFPYRLRQDPSDLNALGRVKFMFPNHYSIYIHDTPGKALFDRQQRHFSSGCVRLEAPLSLATYLLSEQGWDRARLSAAILKGQRQSIVLEHPIPVHLVYFTAWVDENGRVNFGKDIYDRDRQLSLAFGNRSTRPIICHHPAEKALWLADNTTSNTSFISAADTSGSMDNPVIEPTGEVAGDPMFGR